MKLLQRVLEQGKRVVLKYATGLLVQVARC